MLQQSPSTFTILPAIDLRDGRVVRLKQGDFARAQVYADDPLAVARGFAADGAAWVHVVDLDGALAGERRASSVIAAIVAALRDLGARVQVAGGLRTPEAIADVLGAGADRVVIGTAALGDPAFVADACARHGPARIAAALDVRDGQAIGDGWVAGAAGVPVIEALTRLAGVGVTTFAVTAIERDGLLGGPDLALLRQCVAATDAAVIASGGIAELEDLDAVRRIGCRGAIVGRAIYDGRIDLGDALARAAATVDHVSG